MWKGQTGEKVVGHSIIGKNQELELGVGIHPLPRLALATRDDSRHCAARLRPGKDETETLENAVKAVIKDDLR